MVLHGDDTYNYDGIRLNFSSNVYNHFNHTGLYRHLAEQMPCITSYPEPTPIHLESMLGERLGIDSDCIMVTNGATEAIYLIAQTYRGSSSAILQPTFSEYEEACRINGHTITAATGIADDCSQLFWLCNPNNPTGSALPKERVTEMFRSHPDTLFILDQSYAPYCNEELLTAAEAIALGNVLMLHSMTKEYGIPGLRLGYIAGSATQLDRIRQMRMPWSVNAMAIKAGEYLLQHSQDYVLPKAMLIAERERMAAALTATGLVDVMPSDTHILLCRLHEGSAARLKEYLAVHHGILIRDASNFHGLDSSYFRIAVQQPEDNEKLLKCLTNCYPFIF